MKANGEVERLPLHTRSIQLSGYRRADGLFEVEGRLTDTKPVDFQPPSDDRIIKAGEAIHHMAIKIVFDDDMTVHDVIAVTEAAPYNDCYRAPDTLKTLIGLRMSSGWSSEVRRRLSGAASCVHLAGLMAPMATTAYQALTLHRLENAAQTPDETPKELDSCLAYSRHGEIAQRRWPTLYLAKEK